MNAPDLNVKELAGLLGGADADQRASVAESLAQLGSGCREACVELVRACGSDEATREWATAALEEMGAPPATMAEPLVSLLKSECPDVAYWAATLLGRLESEAATAGDVLASVISSETDLFVRERAVWAVQKIGCSSSAIKQALNAAQNSGHPRLSRLANEALGEIDT